LQQLPNHHDPSPCASAHSVCVDPRQMRIKCQNSLHQDLSVILHAYKCRPIIENDMAGSSCAHAHNSRQWRHSEHNSHTNPRSQACTLVQLSSFTCGWSACLGPLLHTHKQHTRCQPNDDGGKVLGVGWLLESHQAHNRNRDLVEGSDKAVDSGSGLAQEPKA